MRYLSFRIRNFKGIQDLELKFVDRISAPIITLVGLNESGKSTVLEALSFFYDNVGKEAEPVLTPGVINEVHDLIPKRLRDNFNGYIEIAANFELSTDDLAEIEETCRASGFKPSKIDSTFDVHHRQRFKNSRRVGTTHLWSLHIEGRQKRGRKDRPISVDDDAWGEVTSLIARRMPPIIYYPNFLFEFPDRIYLEAFAEEEKTQGFYRRLIQDILGSLDNNLDLKTHLVDRLHSGDVIDVSNAESVIQTMAAKVSSVVLDPQLSVFPGDKRKQNTDITISVPKRDPDLNAFYVEFKLREGTDSFFIRERSLGFIWVFTFHLFTQFRASRSNGGSRPVFVFDEPASNLHSSAQKKILKGFERLAAQDDTGSASNATVVYATHSHHLIDPHRLESTFIVRNKALTYDDDSDSQFTTAKTEISVIPYRRFVSEYPGLRSYFQPILDVLEHVPSDLEHVPEVVMVEGKNDFYTLAYMQDVVLDLDPGLNFLPGTGSGTLDSVIQLYYAWGRRFVVLLDSDSEGKRQRERYEDKFGPLVAGKIFTLGDLDPKLEGKGMEKAFGGKDVLRIQAVLDDSRNKLAKKVFNLAMQEALARRLVVDGLTKTSKNSFRKIISELSSRLARQDN